MYCSHCVAVQNDFVYVMCTYMSLEFRRAESGTWNTMYYCSSTTVYVLTVSGNFTTFTEL
jgi:hypothetical protein